MVAMVCPWVEFSKTQNVLDVGTGPGFFSMLLAETEHHMTAVDASPGMVEVAATNIATRDLPVRLYVSDAADLVKEENTIYSCLPGCNSDLPKEKAYQEWLRVLKPGSRVVTIYSKKVKKFKDRVRYIR